MVSWTLSDFEEGTRFFVLRATDPSGNYNEITDPGITEEGLSYRFVDGTCAAGKTYRYRVDADVRGERKMLFEAAYIFIYCKPRNSRPQKRWCFRSDPSFLKPLDGVFDESPALETIGFPAADRGGFK